MDLTYRKHYKITTSWNGGFEWVHEGEYDGAPDSPTQHLCGHCETLEACKKEIDEIHQDHYVQELMMYMDKNQILYFHEWIEGKEVFKISCEVEQQKPLLRFILSLSINLTVEFL